MRRFLRGFRHRAGFNLGAALLVIAVGVLAGSSILESWDLLIYDHAIRRFQRSPDSDIIIVAIDEKTIEELGRWPWSRSHHAEVLDALTNAGTAAVGFDLLFSEADELDRSGDLALSAAIAKHRRVVLPLAPIARSDTAIQISRPIPAFANDAMLGHVDIELDSDGVVRRTFLKAGLESSDHPAFGLALIRHHENWRASLRAPFEIGRTQVMLEDGQSWNRDIEALIPYAGPAGTFRQISYVDVLKGSVDPRILQNKIALVGMTAAGVGTQFATPASLQNRRSMSGVELHANVANMLIRNNWLETPHRLSIAVAAAAWVMFTLVLISTRKQWPVTLVVATVVLSIFIATATVMKVFHLWIPPTAAILGVLCVYPLYNWRRVNEFVRSTFTATARSRTALESIGDGVITLDEEDNIVYMNTMAEKFTKVSLEVARGRALFDVLQLESMVQGDSPQQNWHSPDFRNRSTHDFIKTPNGKDRAVRIASHPLWDEEDQSIGSVIAITDISDAVSLTRQIAHQATHDPLTALANRTLLTERLQEMIDSAGRTDLKVAVMFIDLDGFKKINDALGHRVGDQLLRSVSERLKSGARKGDIVARWGGDEFVVVLDHVRDEIVVPSIVEKILKNVRKPFQLKGQGAMLTASIGVSFYPRDGDSGDALLDCADAAMYRIKRDGGNDFRYYSKDLQTQSRDRLKLENEMHEALLRDEFQLVYQPVVSVNDNRIVRVESLVRWAHPTRGLLNPVQFLPVAEITDLIEKIGSIVLLKACMTGQDFARSGTEIGVSVNIAARQLLRGNLVAEVTKTLEESNFPPHLLSLEVTESAIVTDLERAADVLSAIQQLGVKIALDDFGTGYSSLSLLRDLPFDILKIDKSFTSSMTHNPNDLAISQAIISLGLNLGKEIIAEGVETDEQMQILVDYRCNLHQGYFFSRPVTAGQIETMLADSEYSFTDRKALQS